MKKVILVDGNNLMFRSYYATLYTGNIMRNKDGFPTNGVYGFVNMINKIIDEEKPIYMAVAFDIGKNFRHAKYKDYKAGRQETPTELLEQMPKARTLLDAMGIKHYEVENYEADDIIGTISVMALDDPEFNATIVSSDKDLLQLINKEVDVKLLKTKDFIRYNEKTFEEDYGIKPIRMIDLKALMGDPSDNVPGVKGIGEKNAKILAKKYNTLDKLMAASEAELQSIPDIGPILAQNIIIFFNTPENIELINNLKSIGMNTTYLGATTKENENFIGKRFVVTGTLQKYTRDEIQALIEENGGLWSSSVTKNTAAVIVGDNPGSKYDKAKELNIPIWSEKDFEEQLKSE